MTKVLKKATLIDGTGREPIENAVIVLDGEKISAVGQEGEVTQPPGEVIDLAGKTVLPGLINAHDPPPAAAPPHPAPPAPWAVRQRSGYRDGR